MPERTPESTQGEGVGKRPVQWWPVACRVPSKDRDEQDGAEVMCSSQEAVGAPDPLKAQAGPDQEFAAFKIRQKGLFIQGDVVEVDVHRAVHPSERVFGEHIVEGPESQRAY